MGRRAKWRSSNVLWARFVALGSRLRFAFARGLGILPRSHEGVV